MDNEITLVITLIILILLSAFFSASETAFSSVRLMRMKNMAQQGNKRAKSVVRLCENYDELISTILIGNNIVNIASATLATVLFTGLLQNNGATVSTIVMTLLTLIFGEITPKSVAKQMPDAFALAVVPVIDGLLWLLRPLCMLLIKIKTLVSKRFKVAATDGITETELLSIVDEAEQVGGIESHEGELIHNIIAFNDLQAEDILTPRTDMVAIEDTATIAQVCEVFLQSGYSRLPVYNESLDNIVGILYEKDFYRDTLNNEKSIVSIMRVPEFIPPTIKIPQLLRTFQQKKTHLAIVIDEYGGTDGLITMEDILEELVGEIWDEYDEVDEEIVPMENGKYSVQTNMDASSFFEFFEIKDESEAVTVNGWVLEQLDEIPKVGDSFVFQNLECIVSIVDKRKTQEIIVKRLTNDDDAEKTDK